MYCPLSDCLFYCIMLTTLQNYHAFLDNVSASVAVDFGTGLIPIAISVERYHTCAITNGPGKIRGSLYCWGHNGDGELGTSYKVYDCIQCSCDIASCANKGFS
jgi:Regulator of chromosome condensation (RCC1) repeat